jgi:GTP-binding protein
MPLAVAIVGRPNVGKSTLFNRLAGRRLAIVDDTPGVTRDRREAPGRLGDLDLTLIDTAGFEDATQGTLEARMREQTERALSDADVALFLVDARAGITPLDRHFADWLRGQGCPIVLVVNKAEGGSAAAGVYEAFVLGLGEPIPISAEHGDGMGPLYEALQPLADALSADASAEHEAPTPAAPGDIGTLQMAIVGQPNVGKSTLVNRLLGEERMVTGPEAGITRDAVAIPWTWHERAVRLVDTAGLRRRARIEHKLETLSAEDSFRAIQYAQLVVLVIDATVDIARQDLTIARRVSDEGRILVVAANKWDMIADRAKARRALEERLEDSLSQVKGIPIVTLSAMTGEGIDKLMPACFKAFETWNKRVATAKLNGWLAVAEQRHPPPLVKGRRIRLRYMTQAKTRPPTFVVFSSQGTELPEDYRRYLINGLYEDFGFRGVPLRLLVRRGKNPYSDA